MKRSCCFCVQFSTLMVPVLAADAGLIKGLKESPHSLPWLVTPGLFSTIVSLQPQVTLVYVCLQMYISITKVAACQCSPLNNERNTSFACANYGLYGFYFHFLGVSLFRHVCLCPKSVYINLMAVRDYQNLHLFKPHLVHLFSYPLMYFFPLTISYLFSVQPTLHINEFKNMNNII